MGLGEKTMRTWAYAAASFCVVFGLFALVSSILALIGLKGSLTESVKVDAENLMIVMIVFSVIIVIVGGVAISEVYKTNQLYLRVAYKASTGKIGVRAVAPKRTTVPPSKVKTPPATKSGPNTSASSSSRQSSATQSRFQDNNTGTTTTITNTQGFDLFD